MAEWLNSTVALGGGGFRDLGRGVRLFPKGKTKWNRYWEKGRLQESDVQGEELGGG